MTLVRNRPTIEGQEFGRELARLTQTQIDQLAAEGKTYTRCKSCAFRAGTIPNGCPQTGMTALKCVLSATPFYCHETPDNEGLCQGWAAAVEVLGTGEE